MARERVSRLVQPAKVTHEPSAGVPSPAYQPPFRQVLAAIGLNEQFLQADTVTVSVPALLRLLSALVAEIPVDEAWYLERYPDVHAAMLAGATPSASAHYRAAGFREGRLPSPLPFDADFYFETYKDLAGAFSRTDADELRYHYETRGYQEGRAGVRDHLREAERWAGGLSG